MFLGRRSEVVDVVRQKLWVVRVRHVMIISDLSQSSFRKLACINDFIFSEAVGQGGVRCSGDGPRKQMKTQRGSG